MSADTYRSAFRASLAPPPRLSVSEWADANRVLTSESNPEPGRWRTVRTPYLREIMDSLSPWSPCETVTLMKGAQVGGTECALNYLGYIMACSPGPVLFVQPTVEMAKRWSRQRLDPMLEGTPALRGVAREARSRDKTNTMLMKKFVGGLLIITGANSAVGLRSMPAKYRIYDELDAFPPDADGEGRPVDLGEARARNFKARGKAFFNSTPKHQGSSVVEERFLAGSRGFYHVPCPSCSHVSPLVWRGNEGKKIVWPRPGDKGVDGKVLEVADCRAATAVCEACGVFIEEFHKTWMLERGLWVHADPKNPHRSYHLSSLYSPVGWYSWADAAADWEKAQADVGKLKVFVNTVLGETFAEKGEAPDHRRLYQLREGYKIGEVPRGGLFLTCGVDVQRDRVEFEVVAWGRRRESWSVDYRVVQGDPHLGDVFKSLDQLLDEHFPTAYGRPIPISRLAIDSRYATQAVYAWVRSRPGGRVVAVQGVESNVVPVGVPRYADVNWQGRRMTRGVRVWPVAVGMLKSELYRWLHLQPLTDEEAARPGAKNPAGYCHFPEYAEEYFRQLTAERLVTKKNKRGFIRLEWEQTRDRNEALDCRVYARAAAYTLGMDRFSEPYWDQVEAELSGGRVVKAKGEDEGGGDGGEDPGAGPAAPRRRANRSRFMGG